MKNLLLAVLVVSNFVSMQSCFAGARGNSSGGGGDASEERVNAIRADILKWINDGNAKKLDMPKNLTYESYYYKMSKILQPKEVVIGFDIKKVLVNGVPKTCKGFFSSVDFRPHIMCNISRFKNTSEADQYKLIHHEYAGLVDIENNEGAASDYGISSQITYFLKEYTIQRLSDTIAEVAPKEKAVYGVTICSAVCNGESLNILGHNLAIVGKIYYAEATSDNSTNTNICLANSKTIIVTSNRIIENSLENCQEAMTGKFFNQKVNLLPEKESVEADEGTFFSIELVK